MALTFTERVGIILDLIKDGDVANEAVYASADKATVPVRNKYADALWVIEPGIAVDPANPTNQEKMRNFIRLTRRYWRDSLVSVRAPLKAQAADAAERAAVDAEVNSELGS